MLGVVGVAGGVTSGTLGAEAEFACEAGAGLGAGVVALAFTADPLALGA